MLEVWAFWGTNHFSPAQLSPLPSRGSPRMAGLMQFIFLKNLMCSKCEFSNAFLNIFAFHLFAPVLLQASFQLDSSCL